MIQIISFDMDGTLVDTTFDKFFWGEELPKIYSIQHNVSLEDAKKFCAKQYKSVSMHNVNWYKAPFWFSRLKIKVSADDLVNDMRHHIVLYPDALPVLKKLSKKLDLVLMSNASRYFLNIKVDACKIDKFFSHKISCIDDFRNTKNAPKAFHCMLKKIRKKPENVLHVGDHWNFDYLVPQSMGIKSVFLDRNMKKIGSNVIHSLEELPEMINKKFIYSSSA